METVQTVLQGYFYNASFSDKQGKQQLFTGADSQVHVFSNDATNCDMRLKSQIQEIVFAERSFSTLAAIKALKAAVFLPERRPNG